MTISAIVIAKNEADNIARCLSSLDLCDEKIVVVDSNSQDNTAHLASSLGAKVFTNPWPGYGAQKNFGLVKATGDWLLFIDADERVTPALSRQITSTLRNPRSDHYWLRILTVFLGQPLKHLLGHNPRLVKNSTAHWTDDKVHEQLQTNGGHRIKFSPHSPIIKPPLIHYSHPTISSYLKRMHTYTSLDADQITLTGHHRSGKSVRPSPLLPVQLATKQLTKLLIYRGGLLDGYAGFMWCLLSAYYEWEMAIKYLKNTSRPNR